MVAISSPVDALKADLASGSASTATVSALQHLLTTERSSKPASAHVKPSLRVASKPTTSNGPGGRTRKGAARQPLPVLEDAAETLSPKASYALATEVVNVTLKVLTTAAKSRVNIPKVASLDESASEPAATAHTPRKAPAGLPGPLQPRSGNSTPVSPMADMKTGSRSSASCAGPAPDLVATAECARLAFAYLRSTPPQKLCPKSQPRWQLETGMLALAGRLVALGLDAMAVKELRVLKHRLQSSVLAREAVELSGKVTKTAMAEDPQRETLASLLEFQNTFGNDPEAIGLVISHQLLVLKIIAGSRKPAVIEAALEHLRPEQSGSPAFLMIQQAAAPGGSAKSAKQLELLAQTLLGLCPSTSASSDATAMDPLLSPSPAAVFELQVLPLKFRQIWWKLADHRTNVDRELVEPFSRTLVTFVRRLGSAHRDARAYDLAGELYKLLDLGSVRCRIEFSFEVFKSLAALAEGCGEIGQAALWTEQMASACDSLEPRHARKTACLVKSYTLAASMKPSRDADDATASACSTILQCLREQPSGHIADYDFLLCEVVRLAQSQRTRHTGDFPAVVYLAAGFAQRYARSYPGRHTRSIQAVIQAALRHSKTSDEMQQWVTQDAVQVYIHSGTLQAVAGLAARMSMTESWLSSTDAVALDKILQALVVRYLRRSLGDASVVPLDDETLPAGQRGALLEKQLRHAFDLTSRSKYRPALQKLIPDVLSRLEKTYTLANYPLRRARIATVALCLRESHPALLQPPAAKIWLDNPNIADGVLGEDAELGRLLPDITAGWTVARAFYDGKPTIASLEPSLLAWQHIIDTSTSRVELCEQVYDTAATLVQLAAIAMYLGVLGSDGDRLRVLRLSLQMARLSGCGTDQECMHAIDLSRQCLEMGYSEKAGVLLAGCRAVTADDCISTLTKLQLRIACVEYHFAIDQLERAYTELEQAKGLRATEQPESVARHERRAYELLHARAWLVKSRLAVRNSIPGDALAAAKRAVRLLNATWAAIEHAIEGGDSGSLALADVPDPGEPEMNALSSGISKLQIAPKELPGSKTSVATSNKGASFWAVVPLCCNAMTHLSDMYAHHGLFAEANYYSERAVSIAESVQAKILLVRVQSHRCRLMTVADRLEDAELCLTRSEESGLAGLSVARVEFYSARAALRVKEESFEEALDAYRQAVEIIDKLTAEGLVHASQCCRELDAGVSDERKSRVTSTVEAAGAAATDSETAALVNGPTKGRRCALTSSTKAKAPSKKGAVPKHSLVASSRTAKPPANQFYHLEKMRAELLVECAITRLRADHDIEAAAVSSLHLAPAVCHRHLAYRTLMRKVAQALQSDVSYNSLPESTISFPALLATESSVPTSSTSSFASSSHAPSSKRSVPSKVTARKCGSDEQVATLLLKGRECFVTNEAASLRFCSTAQLHFESIASLSATMLLSAVGCAQAQPPLHPLREALHLELPRITAVQCEGTVMTADKKHPEAPSPFTWPSSEQALALPAMSARHFQQQYVDVLPAKWTAVSVCLNDDCSELYVARYRSGQSPLILRLPFSRHKPEGSDEEAFDYHTGKTELQDIIQVSNYSCHNSGSVEGKGAKSNWWAEREALDRRLHELLVNIENIWFGGFKGVFSQQARQPELLARFRKSFDDILTRYLPSRQNSKGRGKPLALDSKVLKLFIGLGSDQDGIVDLDEPLADLLYFVVDMLQFAGEHNAYDEIDFDGIAVDVLDALRSYHEACPEQGEDARHLILILDKRLQAFPWESLPCLEGASVSRVNSMLGLRERILAMRGQQNSPFDGCHEVSRKSGTYILNPSGDLASTQTTLSPALESLAQDQGAKWKSMVQRTPDEEEFRTALTDSSMLLYFGHGAGSQYIRPRSIRKLDSCSDVVWLMGCSSGAVTEYGELEPSAVPFAYLMAGSNADADTDVEKAEIQAATNRKCMAVVATLWDVTDKDIDRFSLAMGEEWGLWPASEASKIPAKTPRKRERLVAPSTPQQVPKTPKARKTPAPVAKTPARSRSRSQPGRDDGKKRSLVEAVARSRDACYLRYLNGAASVVYGVPVYLDD